MGLNLVDNDSVKDGVGNALGGSGAGNGNFTGQLHDRPVPARAPTITSGPAATPAWTTSTSVSFGFTGGAGVTFLCKLDAGSFSACSSPKSYSGLGQGPHTFQVEAQNAFGTSAPASRAFQIDSIAPPDAEHHLGPGRSDEPDRRQLRLLRFRGWREPLVPRRQRQLTAPARARSPTPA